MTLVNPVGPLTRRERAARHERILALWDEGKTASKIARLIGLKQTLPVYSCIDGRCRCVS